MALRVVFDTSSSLRVFHESASPQRGFETVKSESSHFVPTKRQFSASKKNVRFLKRAVSAHFATSLPTLVSLLLDSIVSKQHSLVNSTRYSTQLVTPLNSLVNSTRYSTQLVSNPQPHLVFLKCSSLLDSIVSTQHSLLNSTR